MKIYYYLIFALYIVSCNSDNDIEPENINETIYNIELNREFKLLTDGNDFNPQSKYLTFVSLFKLNELNEWYLFGTGGYSDEINSIQIALDTNIYYKLEVRQVNKGIGNYGFHHYKDENDQYINLNGKSYLKNKMEYGENIYPVSSDGDVSTGLIYLDTDSTEVVPRTNYDQYYKKIEFEVPPRSIELERIYNGFMVEIKNMPIDYWVIFWGRMFNSFFNDTSVSYYFSGIANPDLDQLSVTEGKDYKDNLYIEYYNDSTGNKVAYDNYIEWSRTEVKKVVLDFSFIDNDSVSVIVD